LVFCSSRFRDPQCGHGGFDEIRDGGMILFLIVGHPGKILSLWVFIIAKSCPPLPQKKSAIISTGGECSSLKATHSF
jgi:hypothetical protein